MYETLRIVEKLRPKFVIWENVKNLLSGKHRHNFDAYIEAMEKLGYQSKWKVLNAKDYGVPQNRERVFTVSILGGGNFEFPQGEELSIRLKDILDDTVSESFYLNDEQIEKMKNQSFHTANIKERVQGEIASTLCARDYKGPKCVQVAQIYGTEREPNPQAGRVYDSGGISPTMDTCSGGNRMPKVAEGYRRKLTPKECWRLMGFSDGSFDKAKASGISNSQLYKQAGNSIVVNVLEGILGNLLK